MGSVTFDNSDNRSIPHDVTLTNDFYVGVFEAYASIVGLVHNADLILDLSGILIKEYVLIAEARALEAGPGVIARNVGLKRFNVLVPALIGRPKRSARAAVAYLNVRLCKEIPIVVPALADRKPVRVHLVRIVGEYVVLREGLPACGHNGRRHRHRLRRWCPRMPLSKERAAGRAKCKEFFS